MLISLHSLTMIYWMGHSAEAIRLWEELSFEADHYRLMGEKLIRLGHVQDATLWLEKSVELDSKSSSVWLSTGKMCHKNKFQFEICDKFLTHQNQNRFLNPDFELSYQSWIIIPDVEAKYAVVDCSNANSGNIKCGRLSRANSEQTRSASFSQCMNITSPATVEFSAELWVDSSARWRALYTQGRINNEIRGIGNDISPGVYNWELYEKVIEVDQFAGDLVCFYPIVMFGEGEALVKNPRLTIISRN